MGGQWRVCGFRESLQPHQTFLSTNEWIFGPQALLSLWPIWRIPKLFFKKVPPAVCEARAASLINAIRIGPWRFPWSSHSLVWPWQFLGKLFGFYMKKWRVSDASNHSNKIAKKDISLKSWLGLWNDTRYNEEINRIVHKANSTYMEPSSSYTTWTVLLEIFIHKAALV